MSNFSDWMLDRYIEFQRAQGRPASVSDFAKHVGIAHYVVRQWLHDTRSPSEESRKKLAKKFGDDVYLVLGLNPPDPFLEEINANWHTLPQEKKDQIMEIVHSEE